MYTTDHSASILRTYGRRTAANSAGSFPSGRRRGILLRKEPKRGHYKNVYAPGAGIRIGCIHIWAKKAGFDKNKIRKVLDCGASVVLRKGRIGGRGIIGGEGKLIGFGESEGLATREEIDKMAEAWKWFPEDESGWHALLHRRSFAPSN
ncbi:hypothetical protein AX14_013085 [Amanita brunnescens Koide BX004]|nr:hypothetical protein AX14_013085 [Amanita brunnescens Koide BX004]